jgi:cytidine kinase
MIEHLAFGIVIDDIRFPDGRTHTGVLGGGGPQTAWGMAAASGSGQAVGIVAQVGTDLNETTLAPLIAAGVTLDGLQRYDGLTPRAWQEIDAGGNRTHVWSVPPRSWDKHLASNWDLITPAYHRARNFHWGLHPENPKLDFSRLLIEEGRRVCLETFKPPEHPLSREALHNMVTACTIFSPNWNEASGMVGSTDYEAVVRRFKESGCRILALRRGDQGADVWNLEAETGVRVPAFPTQVIDTVGAGNAFCGALLVTFDQGMERAAAHGIVAASYLIEQIGLPPALPDRTDYQRRFEWVFERRTPLKA